MNETGSPDEVKPIALITKMAVASGLPMVPAEKRNPLNTTTYGTGELLRDALDKGFTDISIAIGGSATNDGALRMFRFIKTGMGISAARS